MVAWGEIPNAVLMHDTNVTFKVRRCRLILSHRVGSA
jgi:hypothetical protein